MIENKAPLKEPIKINNSGIVLLNNYIPMLFERLGLMQERSFKNTENQLKATNYLQYVISGLSHTEDTYLSLNKVLCGLPLHQPVSSDLDISMQDQQLINGMLNAAISQWTSIGSSSINGFRGNWLVRNGLLIEKEEKWELRVEKRAYDILIAKSPFSFSVIKYHWMDKPLYVNWPY